MSERSRAPEGPRHLAQGSETPSWWRSLDRRHIVVALTLTFAALPVLVVDNLPTGPDRAEAIETTAGPPSTRRTTSTTVAPTTTAPPTTAAPTTAPPTTAPPTTAPPTTVRAVAPTTAPPTTAPPTTAPPTTAPPPPSGGSVEAAIRAAFPADAGDAAVAVARCESSLNPAAVSPSGYKGLFQLSPSHATTFQQVTGRSFDDAWDEAGPNSQYAAYLYSASGWSPWGSCAPS